MNRKAYLACLMVAGMLVAAGSAAAAEKFAYVDLTRTFSEYSKTKDYDKVLGDKQGTYEQEREKMVNDVKAAEDKMKLLSEKEKEAKKGDLENKINALREYDRAKQTDLRKEQDDKMKELLKDINDVIKQYAEKEGYAMVFNDRVLVYQDKSMDITDKIIAILNKGSKK
ncbi:MAG TPA: OmpH family outer membrane protein [Candidatus Omnitrophota bacterium]|nr:OmpH family outer membrane protein [Candidatus Omnitrophota bacterium]HNQ51415.1 OmpH family outer membrane protein [Candidatus Omnitrophota bacterium]HQO38234.1 OmpH family outer membrane protein [Candidatus Omnitrophota bacterium]HQQ06247.1 OmpH family outer membrane protein [Candidatus Omnitrophota bacterium]